MLYSLNPKPEMKRAPQGVYATLVSENNAQISPNP